MLETVELGRALDKETYEREEPQLRDDLLNAQYDLRSADFPVLLIFAGDDRIGFHETVNVVHEWLDARYLETHAIGAPTDEERERPEFWRYWRTLPRNGRMGVYVGGWTLRAIRDRMGKRIKKAAFERALERIVRYEKALVDDGALVLKFWLHLAKDEHRRRIRKAEKDPDKTWRIDEVDHRIFENYDRSMRTVEHALRKTSTVEAPWHVIESTDRRYRMLEIGRRILQTLELRSAAPAAGSVTVAPVPEPEELLPAQPTILGAIDLGATVPKEVYVKRLDEGQAKLHRLARTAVERGVSSVLVFEGWDAAGKGGCVRRLTAAMNAQHYRVVPIAAPTEEERAHHYLWRFWARLPRAGHVTIFDRSWYGRVLVERVEGFATEAEWRRAYGEINEFEEQLVEHGIVLQKFWLHIDRDEQLARFQAREKTAYKKYKITEEDYRNRERWDDYERAVNDMVARTSTELAPWTLVAANDKRHARLKVLATYVDALAASLRGSG
jgi:polyphosphate:AMP phosphotransferase